MMVPFDYDPPFIILNKAIFSPNRVRSNIEDSIPILDDQSID